MSNMCGLSNRSSIDMKCNSCLSNYFPKDDNLTSCFTGILPGYQLIANIYTKQCYSLCKNCIGEPTDPTIDMFCEPNSCKQGYYPKIDNIWQVVFKILYRSIILMARSIKSTFLLVKASLKLQLTQLTCHVLPVYQVITLQYILAPIVIQVLFRNTTSKVLYTRIVIPMSNL
jgi:hypothetical protein